MRSSCNSSEQPSPTETIMVEPHPPLPKTALIRVSLVYWEHVCFLVIELFIMCFNTVIPVLSNEP